MSLGRANRLHPLRRAWLSLVAVHLASILLVTGAGLVNLLPSGSTTALFGGQMMLLGVWLAMTERRISHRLAIASVLICLSAASAAATQLQSQGLLNIPGFLSFAMALGSAVCMAAIVWFPLVLLRTKKWRLVHSSGIPTTMGKPPGQFRVSHLMGLTTFVGGMLVLRALVQSTGTVHETGAVGFSPDAGPMPMITVFGLTSGLLSAAALMACWACLGLPGPAYRLAVAAIPVILLCALPIHVSGGEAQVGWAAWVAQTIAMSEHDNRGVPRHNNRGILLSRFAPPPPPPGSL